MHKTKLKQIILKNLEELKELAEDIINNPVLESREIDLAISKAQTLQMELEMLKETQVSSGSELDDQKGNHSDVTNESKFIPEIITDAMPVEKNADEEVQQQEKNEDTTYLNRQSIIEILARLKSSDRKASKPITQLKTAIGVNDRYYYVREIFNNDVDQFIRVIEELDKLGNMEQAIDFMEKGLKLKENESSTLFIELVKRRFT